jgi:hypothetical protein
MRITHGAVAKTIWLTVLMCEPVEDTGNFFAVVLNGGTTHHAHVLSVFIDLGNRTLTNTVLLLW